MDRSIIRALDPSQSQPIRDPHHFKTRGPRPLISTNLSKKKHTSAPNSSAYAPIFSANSKPYNPPPKANKILNSNLDFSFAPDSYALRTFTTATPATFAPFKSDSSASATIPMPTNENVMRSNLFSTDSAIAFSKPTTSTRRIDLLNLPCSSKNFASTDLLLRSKHPTKFPSNDSRMFGNRFKAIDNI